MRDLNDIDIAPGVVANWAFGHGKTTVSANRISTKVIAGRFCSGQSVQEMARYYKLGREYIEEAIRYEFIRRRDRKPEVKLMQPYPKEPR
jgi:uncharacterized protein (DUF433 family)